MNIKVIEGGAERSDTVARALEAVDERCEFVAIHDAARPCLSAELIDAVFAAAREHGAALPAIPVAETIKRVGEDRFTDRDRPPRGPLPGPDAAGLPPRAPVQGVRPARRGPARRSTDDCQLVEAIGHRCAVVEGSRLNIKITTHEDLKLAAAILPLLDKPKREGPSHPYSDEQAIFDKLPKLKASDLFGS